MTAAAAMLWQEKISRLSELQTRRVVAISSKGRGPDVYKKPGIHSTRIMTHALHVTEFPAETATSADRIVHDAQPGADRSGPVVGQRFATQP